jgi:lipopolysaccharide/colanic/teichoic acid biosynthesis glycosyltransferase
VSWEEKFEMDVWYVDNVSWRLDVRVLWRTLRSVIVREGITADGHATAPAFLGSNA